MWIETNPNPCGRLVGDCTVRALAIALGITWEEAFDLLADAAYKMCDVMSGNSVLGAVLRMHGFRMESINQDYIGSYTVEQFAKDNPHGIYVLGTNGHVVTVISGNVYDAWDSSREHVLYVWYRKDE